MITDDNKLCLLICKYYLREAETILESGEFKDVSVEAYPPACVAPHDSFSSVEEIMKRCSERQCDCYLVSGCFFASRKIIPALEERCWIHRVEQCFHLLAGKDLIDSYIKEGGYILSPGWLTEWPFHLRHWGFDHITARAFFAESVRRLVLFDTGIYEGSEEELRRFASYVDRPYMILPVGTDYFRLLVTNMIMKWRVEKTRRRLQAASQELSRMTADQAMSFDLLAGLTRMKTEAEAIEHIVNLFNMLFAPEKMVYVSVQDGKLVKIHSYPEGIVDERPFIEWLENGRRENVWIEEQKGFNIRLSHLEQTLGLLEVRDIAFPEYQKEYLSLAILLSRVCSLAISNGRLFQEISRQAITDSLTSLFNRRHFISIADREFSQAMRYGRPLAVLMLDIDHFKYINDTLGHAAGDRALVEVAALCMRELRDTDILGRYGGEEFVFLMPETDKEGARRMAERLRKRISELDIMADGRSFHVTVSVGVASADADCADLESLLDRSDKALYAAKRAGRNRVEVFNERIGEDKAFPSKD